MMMRGHCGDFAKLTLSGHSASSLFLNFVRISTVFRSEIHRYRTKILFVERDLACFQFTCHDSAATQRVTGRTEPV